MRSTRPGKRSAVSPLYQLKIVLKWSKPVIWRRVVVRQDMALDNLHDVFQVVMGWADCHLHHFMVGDRRTATYYGTLSPDGYDHGGTLDESLYTLHNLATAPKAKFTYEYDFGDGWMHEVKVEKVLAEDESFKNPVCIGGAGACPPEDCGGISGYYNLLDILADPEHEDYESMKDWMGDGIDPDAFDLEAVNTKLRRIKA